MENQAIPESDLSNEMICSIAATTALGVNGVEKMFMRLSDEILDAIYPSAVSSGVKVIKYDEGYEINLHIITALYANIPRVAAEVQKKVAEAVHVMVGQRVSKVNVHIKGCGKY